MPQVPAELDVFRLAHRHMKKLVKDIDVELLCTNFGDSVALQALLDHLNSRFHQFKSHEEIEKQYIVSELLPRLPSHADTTLENDIHSDNRLSELVRLVNEGLQCEFVSESDRVHYGRRLKAAIENFTTAFIPHMDEEEEVFMPLLMEYFTEKELKQLTRTVNELHHLDQLTATTITQASGTFAPLHPQQPHTLTTPTLLHLPPEVLLNVLSYLSPMELLSLSQVHSKLNTLAFDGSLWQHLHPIRWARGHLRFFEPPKEIGVEQGIYQDVILENDMTKELLSVEGKVNANMQSNLVGDDVLEEAEMERERILLCGIIEHLLPRVGDHVSTLDLAYGKAVTNEVVFRMLRQCPNLHYLDVSHTKISDFAFRGLLSRGHRLWQLEFLDLSGCSLITDTALQRVSQALTFTPSHNVIITTSSHHCWEGGGGCRESQLKCIILSGCHHITDVGLRSLALKGLPHLCYLDLSGLPHISHHGLSTIVSVSPRLQPEHLFYCDNVPSEGSYSECANGCQNVGSSSLACCRQVI